MDSLHTATATARGGREGFVRSKAGTIDLPSTMADAHEACRYSKATVGNMAVEVVAET
jgi:organic hydroperoxide reductase OsmC/OhrA